MVLDFRAGAVYRAALAAGAVAVLALLALLLLPQRSSAPEAVRGRDHAPVWIPVAAVAGVALIGGVVGVLALMAAAGVARPLRLRPRPRHRVALAALAGGSLLAAGTLFLTVSGPAAQAAVQVLALLAVSAVAASLLTGGPGRGFSGTAFRHRRIGRSNPT